MTERTSWYRANAEKCFSLAQKFRDPESKRAMLAMANAWLALAEQSAKNSETALASDTPPQPISPDRPAEPGDG